MNEWDWLQTFQNKFNHYNELQSLTSNHFHGSLTLHFADGQPHSCELHRNFRADKINKIQPKLKED